MNEAPRHAIRTSKSHAKMALPMQKEASMQLGLLIKRASKRFRRNRGPDNSLRRLGPFSTGLLTDDNEKQAREQFFDESFYLQLNVDVTRDGIDPFRHYIEQGWREGRDPGPNFSTQLYLSQNRDVESAGLNPLIHYLAYGQHEGRPLPQPIGATSRDELQDQVEATLRTAEESGMDAHDGGSRENLDPSVRQALETHFDITYYLSENPDVAVSDQDPVEHFHTYGWQEGRNPSPSFDVKFYLKRYDDVASIGMNPLLHYAYAGQSEGRQTRRRMHEARTRIERAVPPALRAMEWTGAWDRFPHTDEIEIWEALDANFSNLVVSFSHDDYATNIGGVQNIIRSEVEAANDVNWDYLHLSPARPLPMLSSETDPSKFSLQMRLNGKQIGAASALQLATLLKKASGSGKTIHIIVHHLLGHSPEVVSYIISDCGCKQPLLWIHDFFALCPSYNLLRNDIVFCGAPPIGSAACQLCVYGTDRVQHIERFATFFDAINPIILAPSECALQDWLEMGNLRHSAAIVQAPARLLLGEPVPFIRGKSVKGPMRVAHLGARAYHKGWAVFQSLADDLAEDARYTFYQLGDSSGPSPSKRINHVNVRVTEANPKAMIDAIVKNKIDIVVNWSIWPETFNFIVYESLAAGAFVVARRDAGNVWPAVKVQSPNQGMSVCTEEELTDLFKGSELEEAVRISHYRLGVLTQNSGSLEILLA